MGKNFLPHKKLRVTSQKIKQIFEDYTKIFSKIDWNNPESIIVFHQSIYRLFALANSDFKILHGSATVTPRGLSIIFGDDGRSMGKTTCAYEVARHSKKWISDEFVLYNKGRIFANGEYPLHFKEGSRNYFKFLNRKFTNWIYPKKEKWEIINDVVLDVIVCPVLSGKNTIKRLNQVDADRARRTTAYAHLAKLIYPSLDRLSIFTGNNDQGPTIKALGGIADSLNKFNEKIPIYELQFKNFHYIIPLLKKANLY